MKSNLFPTLCTVLHICINYDFLDAYYYKQHRQQVSPSFITYHFEGAVTVYFSKVGRLCHSSGAGVKYHNPRRHGTTAIFLDHSQNLNEPALN